MLLNHYQLSVSYMNWSGHRKSYALIQDLDRSQERALKSHIQAQDYFGTLATVLSLFHQNINNTDDTQCYMDKDTMVELVDELIFLQDRYYIQEKNQSPYKKR